MADPINYEDFAKLELRVAKGADPQRVLAEAMKTSTVRRFEVVEPSLEEIFIDTVEKTKVEKVVAVTHA